MPLDRFQHIVDDLCENRPLLKLYVSGEPLLHPNLCEMIDYAGAKACQTMIHTNATGLTQEMSEKLLSSPLTFLSFSFDGCSPEVYERLHPPAQFEQVRSNIRRYLDLRRRHGRGPHTTIEIIRMQDTDKLIQSFVEEWKTSGVDEVRIAPYLTWHGLVDDRHVECRPPVPLFKPCAAPFQHGCILSDGTAVPCCLERQRPGAARRRHAKPVPRDLVEPQLQVLAPANADRDIAARLHLRALRQHDPGAGTSACNTPRVLAT